MGRLRKVVSHSVFSRRIHGERDLMRIALAPLFNKTQTFVGNTFALRCTTSSALTPTKFTKEESLRCG
jgi:hypothetical protein